MRTRSLLIMILLCAVLPAASLLPRFPQKNPAPLVVTNLVVGGTSLRVIPFRSAGLPENATTVMDLPWMGVNILEAHSNLAGRLFYLHYGDHVLVNGNSYQVVRAESYHALGPYDAAPPLYVHGRWVDLTTVLGFFVDPGAVIFYTCTEQDSLVTGRYFAEAVPDR